MFKNSITQNIYVYVIFQTDYSGIRLINPRLINPAAYYIQFAWNGIVPILSRYFRKRRLLKPPRIKSKTGCPEVDLLTEFHCSYLKTEPFRLVLRTFQSASFFHQNKIGTISPIVVFEFKISSAIPEFLVTNLGIPGKLPRM